MWPLQNPRLFATDLDTIEVGWYGNLVWFSHHDDPEFEFVPNVGSESEEMLGAGMLRLASSGGSFAKRCIRSSFMAFAFNSVKPGFRSPTTVDEKEESSLVAWRAWQKGHSVSSTLA